MTRLVNFVAAEPWWHGLLDEDLMGPAGSVTFELDSLSLEFDRVDLHPMAVVVDGDLDEAPDWLRRVIPDIDRLLGAVGESVSGVRVELDGGWVPHAAAAARLYAELDDLRAPPGGEGPVARAFRFAAELELAGHLGAVASELPGTVDAQRAARRAQQAVPATGPGGEEARDWILDPRRPERLHTLQDLLRATGGVTPPTLREAWEAATLGPPDIVDRAPERKPEVVGALLGPSGAAATGVGTAAGTSVAGDRAPRWAVRDGTFIVGSPVAAAPARGTVTGDEDALGGAYRVEIGELTRSEGSAGTALGPLWVRLFADGELVAGGVLAAFDGGLSADLPAGGRLQVVTEIEVWVNPYRHRGSAAPLATAGGPLAYADEALRLGRDAARRAGAAAAEAWASTAEAWLAAGYLDRAALAFALAGDQRQALLWSRSPAVRDRVVRSSRPRPLIRSLRWHPWVSPP